MAALVTSATGFVGAAVARALLAEGRRVKALVRSGSDRRNLAGLDLETLEGSLEDHASLARAVKGSQALYHVAADYRLWVPDPAAMYRANVDGTRALMQAALEAGVERIVYTSSVATLGIDPDGAPSDETTPVSLADMIGPYKRSKFLAEEAVSELIAKRGLPCVIVNPSTPVGPRDRKPTPTGRVVLEAAKGHVPAYVDTGLNLVHVDDVAAGHLLAYARGRVGERYILGGDNLSLKDMLTEIARLTGGRPPLCRIPRRLLYPVAAAAEAWGRLTGREPLTTLDGLRMAKKRMFFSSAKAIAALGYKPRPAGEGLAAAIGWFREAGYLR
jgi:dihydroflavonol-4-reductase